VSPPAAGHEFGGFRLEGELGRGGMGVVYLAEQLNLGRKVALKVIAPELSQDPDFQARFEREARLAASLDHPNVVPVFEAGNVDGLLYLAMRYVKGTDLGALLAAEGRLLPERAAHIADQLGAALDAAHGNALIHRDVKPGNVLLAGQSASAHVYLTDFGLTKEASSQSAQLTNTGQWVGTVDYVAPEQLDGRPIDARTDVYSLGCVIFQMLAGTVPYGGTSLQKMWGHGSAQPPSLQNIDPELARRFDPVIARAMAKDPDHRFRSAGDLGRAAIGAAYGQPVTVPERSVAVGAAAEGSIESGPGALLGQSGANTTIESAPQAPATAVSPPGIPQPAVTTAGPAPPTPPPRRRRVMIPIAVATVLVLVIGTGALLASRGNDKDPVSAKSATPVKPATRASVSRSAAAPPRDSTLCSKGLWVGPKTTCPFAEAVKEAYPGSKASFTAHSSVTGLSYTMRCTTGTLHSCHGGKDARVYFRDQPKAPKPAGPSVAFRSYTSDISGYTTRIPTGPEWSDPVETEPSTRGELYRTTVNGPDGLILFIEYTPKEPARFGSGAQSTKQISQTAFGTATEYVFSGGLIPECKTSTCVDYIVNDPDQGSGFGVVAGGSSNFALAKKVARTAAQALAYTE
jgi:protein kinase-like protein